MPQTNEEYSLDRSSFPLDIDTCCQVARHTSSAKDAVSFAIAVGFSKESVNTMIDDYAVHCGKSSADFVKAGCTRCALAVLTARANGAAVNGGAKSESLFSGNTEAEDSAHLAEELASAAGEALERMSFLDAKYEEGAKLVALSLSAKDKAKMRRLKTHLSSSSLNEIVQNVLRIHEESKRQNANTRLLLNAAQQKMLCTKMVNYAIMCDDPVFIDSALRAFRQHAAFLMSARTGDGTFFELIKIASALRSVRVVTKISEMLNESCANNVQLSELCKTCFDKSLMMVLRSFEKEVKSGSGLTQSDVTLVRHLLQEGAAPSSPGVRTVFELSDEYDENTQVAELILEKITENNSCVRLKSMKAFDDCVRLGKTRMLRLLLDAKTNKSKSPGPQNVTYKEFMSIALDAGQVESAYALRDHFCDSYYEYYSMKAKPAKRLKRKNSSDASSSGSASERVAATAASIEIPFDSVDIFDTYLVVSLTSRAKTSSLDYLMHTKGIDVTRDVSADDVFRYEGAFSSETKNYLKTYVSLTDTNMIPMTSVASLVGRPDMVDHLVSKGAPLEDSALIFAVYSSTYSRVCCIYPCVSPRKATDEETVNHLLMRYPDRFKNDKDDLFARCFKAACEVRSLSMIRKFSIDEKRPDQDQFQTSWLRSMSDQDVKNYTRRCIENATDRLKIWGHVGIDQNMPRVTSEVSEMILITVKILHAKYGPSRYVLDVMRNCAEIIRREMLVIREKRHADIERLVDTTVNDIPKIYGFLGGMPVMSNTYNKTHEAEKRKQRIDSIMIDSHATLYRTLNDMSVNWMSVELPCAQLLSS